MKQMPISTETLDAVKRCFDAYGADISRWPQSAREHFGALASSDELAEVRREAELLDGFLGAATAPRMSADLKNRIAAQYAPPPEKISIGRLMSGMLTGRRFVPAGAAAGIGALGLITGMVSANTSLAMTPEDEAFAYAYSENFLSSTTYNEEEALQWDEG